MIRATWFVIAALAFAVGCGDAAKAPGKTPAADATAFTAADLKPVTQADGTALLNFTFVDKAP